ESAQSLEQKLKAETEARDTRLTQILFDIAHWFLFLVSFASRPIRNSLYWLTTLCGVSKPTPNPNPKPNRNPNQTPTITLFLSYALTFTQSWIRTRPSSPNTLL